MSAPDTVVAGVCFRCGGGVTTARPTCPFCGMPVLPELLAPAPALGPVRTPAGFMGPPPRTAPTLTEAAATGGAFRRPGLIALGVVAVLLIAVGGVAAVARLVTPSPAVTVRHYFAALSAGDAAKALSYVRSSDQISTAAYPLLGAPALAGRAHRPGDVHIGKATAVAGVDLPAGFAVTDVAVTYRVRGRAVAQTVRVLTAGGKLELQSPFVELVVSGVQSRPLTVNGVALGSSDVDTAAFPGSYDVAAAGNVLFAAGSGSATPQQGPQGPVAQVGLGPPALADGAQAQIQQQVRTALDACAASSVPYQQGCPFALTVPGTDAIVHWSITTYPAITAQPAQTMFGGAAAAIGDDGTGSVHWDVTYTGWSGGKQHQSGDTPFAIHGTAQPSGSGIQISLTG